MHWHHHAAVLREISRIKWCLVHIVWNVPLLCTSTGLFFYFDRDSEKKHKAEKIHYDLLWICERTLCGLAHRNQGPDHSLAKVTTLVVFAVDQHPWSRQQEHKLKDPSLYLWCGKGFRVIKQSWNIVKIHYDRLWMRCEWTRTVVLARVTTVKPTGAQVEGP